MCTCLYGVIVSLIGLYIGGIGRNCRNSALLVYFITYRLTHTFDKLTTPTCCS